MLEQDSVNAAVYARSGETWTHEILIADSIFSFPEIGVDFPSPNSTKALPLRRSRTPTGPPTARPRDPDFLIGIAAGWRRIRRKDPAASDLPRQWPPR